jgi:hypothetical protein
MAERQAKTVVVNESPHPAMVLKTWQIGVESEARWIFALDADVVLNANALEKAIERAEAEDRKFLRMAFRIRDKFRGRVYAGCHVYNGLFLDEALGMMTSSDFIWTRKRPESGAAAKIAPMLGLVDIHAKNKPLGRHDFEQWYAHVLAKYYNRGIRDAQSFEKIEKMIRKGADANPDDKDFLVALEGLGMAKGKTPDDMLLDSERYPDPAETFLKLGIREKPPLTCFDAFKDEPQENASATRRKDIIPLIDPDPMLKEYEESARGKPLDHSVVYCTCFSNKPGSWPTLAKLWLYSIIDAEPVLPLVHIVYEGERPSFFDGFSFVSLSELEKPEGQMSMQPLFNFWGKPQAIGKIDADFCCWIDCDILIVNGLMGQIKSNVNGNMFIRKTNRVGGGFYCLTRASKPAFLAAVREEMKNEERLKSDQKVILRAIRRAEMEWTPIPRSAFLHLDKKTVKKENEEFHLWIERANTLLNSCPPARGPIRLSSTSKSFFENSWFINLDHRTDRLAHALFEFDRLGISPERVSAIALRKKGHYSCCMSHVKTLERAIETGCDIGVFFEDDVMFHPQFNVIFEQLYPQLMVAEWDMFYFEGHPNNKPPILMKKKKHSCTQAHAIRRGSMQRVIDAILGNDHLPVDRAIGTAFCDLRVLCPNLRLAIQQESYSDINSTTKRIKRKKLLEWGWPTSRRRHSKFSRKMSGRRK